MNGCFAVIIGYLSGVFTVAITMRILFVSIKETMFVIANSLLGMGIYVMINVWQFHYHTLCEMSPVVSYVIGLTGVPGGVIISLLEGLL